MTIIDKGDSLELKTRTVNYTTSAGHHVILRAMEPSAPHGAWPGNNVVMRVWDICAKGQACFRRCSRDEVETLEKMIGEVKSVTFFQHPTVGEVATPTV